MKDNFEVGQLVRGGIHGDIGRVVAVDRDYHGARQAFKVYGAKPGQVIRPGSENGIGPTKDGIRDRVKVQWYTDYGGFGASITLTDGKDLSLLEEQGEE